MGEKRNTRVGINTGLTAAIAARFCELMDEGVLSSTELSSIDDRLIPRTVNKWFQIGRDLADAIDDGSKVRSDLTGGEKRHLQIYLHREKSRSKMNGKLYRRVADTDDPRIAVRALEAAGRQGEEEYRGFYETSKSFADMNRGPESTSQVVIVPGGMDPDKAEDFIAKHLKGGD